MNEVQLQSCTRPELLALAGKAKVRGRQRMTKDQLIRAIRSRAATASIAQRGTHPSRRSQKKGPPQGERKSFFENNDKTARPEERPSSGRVSKGARRRQSTVSSPNSVDALAAGQPQGAGLKELTELPSSYGHTRLTLMSVDPYHIHAYWEVTPHDRETTMTRLGPEGAKARWVLRFYDVTYIDFDGTNAHVYFDQPIDLIAGNWYVELWSSEKTYCADIGALAPSGQFESACRSNFVQVPRAEASTDYRPEWLRVEGNFDKVQAAVSAAEPSPTEQSAALTMTATIASPEREPAPQEPIPFAAEADIRRHSAALVPAAWENRASESSTTAANETSAARCARQDAPGETRPGGARREAHFPETVSSFGSGVWTPAGRTAADLTLNADVVISGRCQPGQAIQVNGQWLKAGADGTFSLRLTLPIKE
jgi:hypothetical protein